MKRNLPLILLGVGLTLALGAVGLILVLSPAPSAPASPGEVPAAMAGFQLSQRTSGSEAVSQIKQMHWGEFEIVDGEVAIYGASNVVLWVSVSTSPAEADRLALLMEEAIASQETPFSPQGVYTWGGRPVSMLEGNGQLHFYFQSAQKVIWLAADPVSAEQALQEVLAFYP